jgi:hypothetical protein
MNFPTLFSRLAAPAVLAAALAWSGCHSAPYQRDLMSDALTAGEQPVAMKGEGSFLAGKLTAIATVSRGFDRGTKGPAREKRGGRFSKDDDNSPFTDSYSSGFGDSESEQQEAYKAYVRMAMAQRAAGSPMPPVTLRVNFVNHGTEPMDVEITDVNSELGNFAVRPPKLTLQPGETGALEPMISQLGVTSDEIPLQVVVRYAGKKETQTITVKNLILPSVKKS